MKIFPLLLLLCTSCAFAQVKVTKLTSKTLPSHIQYKGKLIDAAQYTDNNGQHIVITTETGIIPIKDADGSDFRKAALDAYNYKVVDDKATLTWKVHDFVDDCALDVEAKYLPGTFAVTDVDKNGVAEVWLMYVTTCTGDVSPLTMKIIMYTNNKKFAVRGSSKVQVSATEYDGGEYQFDAAFKQGPATYRNYASQLWNKNILWSWK